MKIVTVLLSVLIALIFYYFGGDIPMAEQIPLYESLRNTSAIIFGVMGAWIAILYPNALLEIYGKGNVVHMERQSKTIKQLISPMILSTIIVSLVLVVGLLVPVVRRIELFIQYKEILRALSFSILGVLTFVQLWALLATLIPSDMIQGKIDHTIKKRKKVDSIFPDARE